MNSSHPAHSTAQPRRGLQADSSHEGEVEPKKSDHQLINSLTHTQGKTNQGKNKH